MWQGGAFGYVPKSESGQRRLEYLRQAIEHELPVDAHLQFLRALLEFPRVNVAVRRHAQIDALVTNQVLRLFGWRHFREIGRRCSSDWISSNFGPSERRSLSPASVGATLRVVRVSSRTPSLDSSARIA